MQQPLTFTELKEFTQRLDNFTHFLNRARVSTEITINILLFLKVRDFRILCGKIS
jgi:hypothetical protein